MESFAEKCYEVLRRVPRGRVTTYGEIAKAVGVPRGARAVGNAMNKNPYAPKVPCHRVVFGDGRIGGFAGEVKVKVSLLRGEGVRVRGGKVVDFSGKVCRF